jgi:hypothetical protein
MRTLAILGGAIIATKTPTCTTEDITAVGNFYRSVYRPNIAPPPDSQAKEALSLISERSAFILEATGKTLRGKANASALVIGSRAEAGEAPTTVDLTITPTKITPSTPSVEIKGTINNLFNVAGCNVTVVGALGLRPPG